MNIRELADSTPFTGDYTGRDEIGPPTCFHVFRSYRGKRINPIRCLRHTKSKRSKYCHLHDTKRKREVTA